MRREGSEKSGWRGRRDDVEEEEGYESKKIGKVSCDQIKEKVKMELQNMITWLREER